MTEAERTTLPGDVSSEVAGRGQASWPRPTSRSQARAWVSTLCGGDATWAEATVRADDGHGWRCRAVRNRPVFPARPSPTFLNLIVSAGRPTAQEVSPAPPWAGVMNSEVGHPRLGVVDRDKEGRPTRPAFTPNPKHYAYLHTKALLLRHQA